MGRASLRLLLGGFLLSFAVFVGGCGQSTGGGTPSPGTQGAPVVGGEFRVNMIGEPDTIDPHRSNFATSLLVASKVFEGLFTYDKDLNLAPGVAKELPTIANGGVSSDGKTYTIKLREDAKWSDGQPVTAKHFIYAIKRSLDPRLAAPYAGSLYDIEGARAYNSAKESTEAERATLRDQVAISAPNDTTLVVRLAAPRPSFLHQLSLWIAWPAREEIITKYGDKWTEPPNYVGNGPFILSQWAHQERLEFVPNPHYTGQKPYVAKLVLVQMADANQAYLAYTNGELDAVAIPEAYTKQVLADPSLENQRRRYNELVVFGYQFNVKAQPFDNPKVRQALALAVDRRALIENVSQGIGQPAYSPVPPGMPGYDPNVGKEFKYNPTRAKQLLSDAGYSDPSKLQITFTFADNSANRLRSEFFQAQMKQNLGVEITAEPLDARAFQQRYNAGQFVMAFGGWGADYPDPDNIVPQLFMTGSGNNKNQYSNPAVDAQAKLCQSDLDEARRMAACAQAQKLVAADQPWIFLFYRERFWLVKPYVKGFQATPKDHLPGDRFYHQIWLQR